MSLSTGGISQLSGGAGRAFHVDWPSHQDSIGGAPGNNGIQRIGTVGVANITQNATVGTPPATTTPAYKGLRCWKVFSATAGAGLALWFNYLHNAARDATKYPLLLDDRSVFEVRWLLAFDRPAGDLSDSLDLGVQIFPGSGNGNIFNPATGSVYRAGIEFGPGGPGKLRFRGRGGQTTVGPPPYSTGLGFDTTNVVPSFAFDEREWHWYAIRLVGASNAGDMICKALLDGVEFSRFSGSTAAGIFPDPVSWPAAIGVRGGICNQSNGTFDGMYFARGQLILAQTEADIV